MEDWQKDHIRGHLPELIESTDCSNIFLAALYSGKIINKNEVDGMNLPILTKSDKAGKLYDLITSRIGGYDGVKQALLKTGQSGALEILSQVNRHNVETPFKNLGAISYDNDTLLGKGCNNTRVYKGKFGLKDVAVKVLTVHEDEVGKIKEEVELMSFVDSHENIVRYFTTEISETQALIAMELCTINLHDLVKNGLVFQIGAMEILQQSTKGLSFLHSKNIIHRDLKPANILISYSEGEGAKVKISDFGLSRKIPEGGTRMTLNSTGVGTEGWIPPEVLSPVYNRSGANLRIQMSLSADIFPLGCIFYFVTTEGEHPFGEEYERKYHILKRNLPILDENIIKCPLDDKPKFIDLIKKMIAHDEKERPTARDVLANSIFLYQGSQTNVQLQFNSNEGEGFATAVAIQRKAKPVEVEPPKTDSYPGMDSLSVANEEKEHEYDSHLSRGSMSSSRIAEVSDVDGITQLYIAEQEAEEVEETYNDAEFKNTGACAEGDNLDLPIPGPSTSNGKPPKIGPLVVTTLKDDNTVDIRLNKAKWKEVTRKNPLLKKLGIK